MIPDLLLLTLSRQAVTKPNLRNTPLGV